MHQCMGNQCESWSQFHSQLNCDDVHFEFQQNILFLQAHCHFHIWYICLILFQNTAWFLLTKRDYLFSQCLYDIPHNTWGKWFVLFCVASTEEQELSSLLLSKDSCMIQLNKLSGKVHIFLAKCFQGFIRYIYCSRVTNSYQWLWEFKFCFWSSIRMVRFSFQLQWKKLPQDIWCRSLSVPL